MAKLSDSATTDIAAPIDAVWAIVRDVPRWPEWQGTLGSLDVLERDDEGHVTLCAIELDAKVTTIKMKLECEYRAPKLQSFARVSGDLSSLSGAWRLEELADGGTRATYELNVNPGGVLNFFLNEERIGKLRGALVDVRPGELKVRAEAPPG